MSSTSFVWTFGCRYQIMHKKVGNTPKTKDEDHQGKRPGRPTWSLVARPPNWPNCHIIDPTLQKKHKGSLNQPQDQVSNVSKG